MLMLVLSHASVIFNGLIRWLDIFAKLSQVFASSYTQIVCDDCMRWLDWDGIVHVMLKRGAKA